MTELYVDPDSLTAAATVASRQRDHVQQVSSYISSACGQFGAFTGVLDLFEGSYREAVTTALSGMDDGMTIAEKVQEAFVLSRNDYLETDREVYDEFRQKYGDLAEFPPYEAPGSGNSVPTNGISDSKGGKDEDGDGIPDIPKLPAPPEVGPLGDRFHERRDDAEIPPVVAPVDALKDRVLTEIRDAQTRQEYMDLRAQGMSPEEAYRTATAGVDEIADTRVHDQIETNAQNAYQDAYDDAVADGRSPEDAERAGQDAAGDSRASDSADHDTRRDAIDGGRTIYDGVNEVNSTVDNLNDLADNVEQLQETTGDLDDYDDYESEERDDSVREWANQ